MMPLFAVLGILGIVFILPRMNVKQVMTTALSKGNRGIILDYFSMSSQRTLQVLGEPEGSEAYPNEQERLVWDFDPVTLELLYNGSELEQINYRTVRKDLRDHIENRALQVYGSEEDWKQRHRLVFGEKHIVFLNESSNTTVLKTDSAVHVYNSLFPQPLTSKN